MEVPLFEKSIDANGNIIRPFSDFLIYLRGHAIPKGAILLFKGDVPKGYTEVTELTAPTGFKYGSKN